MSDRFPRKPNGNEDDNNSAKKFKPKRKRISRSEGSKYEQDSSEKTEPEKRNDNAESTSFYDRRGRYGDSDLGSERTPYQRTPPDNKDNDRPYRKPFNRDGDNRPPRQSSYGRSDGDRNQRSSFRRNDGDRSQRSSSYRGNDSDRPNRKPFDKSRPAGSRFDRKPGGKRPFEKKQEPFSKEDYKKKKAFAKPAPQSFERKPESETIRLNKFISNSGICSRREADDLITAGLVSVNGVVITELGTKINLNDIVRYNNEIVKNERLVYLLLNKPKDFITTMDDPEQRNTVMQLVASACKERIYPVGRLDRNTTGLLLFTNDGEMAKKLTHPSSEVRKVYHVELDRNLKSEDMEQVLKGVELEDGIAEVDDIAYDAAFGDKSQVGVELHSGKNRIVRRIFEKLGYDVRKLDRVVFAGLTKKDLPRGRWRFLEEMEVTELRNLVSDKKKKSSRSKKSQD